MRARTSLLLALTCLCCATLGGCGQTGALYLPTKEGEVVSKGPEASAQPLHRGSLLLLRLMPKRPASANPQPPTPAPK